MNQVLYRRGIKGNIKLLVILLAVITMYISVIVYMYNPEMEQMLDEFSDLMPEIMAAVGMRSGSTNLIGFMCSYLYGFILLIFPMLFSMIRANTLVSSYVEKGSMVSLIAAPIKRSEIIRTQIGVLCTGIVTLVICITGIEIGVADYFFPGDLGILEVLLLNGGLLCLHLCIASICFLFSVICSETKYSLTFGVGIPVVMYVVQMIANLGGDVEKAKYFTLFTLFNPEEILDISSFGLMGMAILFVISIVLFMISVQIFKRKNLHI